MPPQVYTFCPVCYLSFCHFVCLAVCLSITNNLNLAFNFETIQPRAFKLQMSLTSDETFPAITTILTLWYWHWPLTYCCKNKKLPLAWIAVLIFWKCLSNGALKWPWIWLLTHLTENRKLGLHQGAIEYRTCSQFSHVSSMSQDLSNHTQYWTLWPRPRYCLIQ